MNHLELLRNEHVRLQTKFVELQRQYDVLEANYSFQCSQNGKNVADIAGDGFVKRLLDLVVYLYNKDIYSDITIHVDGQQLRAHKFVLASRTNFWSDLSLQDSVILTDLTFANGVVLLKWIYTDTLDDKLENSCILALLGASINYNFKSLKNRCETLLIGRLELENCAQIYQFAETYSLERLRNSCTEFVSVRWQDFQPQHFKDMSAPLLYEMLKGRSLHVLNSIITLQREDVLFLYLIDNDSLLTKKLNEMDEQGKLPLELAFETHQMNIAKNLTLHGADVNKLDGNGFSFLLNAVQSGNLLACEFLIQNNVNITYVNKKTGENLLHILAQLKNSSEIINWAQGFIADFQINAVDFNGKTPLMIAIEENNDDVFELIVLQEKTNVNVRDLSGTTALDLALLIKKNLEMANKLVVERKANLNLVDAKRGDTLFHKAVSMSDFAAIHFLVKHGADINITNENGSTPLHLFFMGIPSHGTISSEQFETLRILLKAGADPALKETQSGSTPLHFAVERDKNILKILLEFNKDLSLSVLDKENRSPLWCSLLAGKFDSAKLLLDAGADVNEKSVDGKQLLIRAIESKRDDITRFLLDNKAIAAVTSSNGFTCLNLAVQQGLTSTVDYLCKLGANLNYPNPETNLPPLWTALDRGDYGTAEVLVEHGCDLEGWAISKDSSLEETLLHRTIDMCNQKASVFLIKNGCNVNALRRLPDPALVAALFNNHIAKTGTESQNKMEINPAIRQTPLHTSVQWGLADVTKALVSNLNCKIDAQDYDGRTPAHIAVLEQDQITLELLLSHPDPSSVLSLRDRYGQTPLAMAIRNKYTKAAEAICRRLPHTAVQVNGSGENLLHCAVKTDDLESVLFLLGLHVDVNITTQDPEKITALHICADVGNELILRNLLLAGADVNVQSTNKQTPLHYAARRDHAELCTIFLENDANPNISDSDGNNSLHAAVSCGAVSATQILLLESNVDYMAVNKRKQNIMHLCAINIGIISAEVFLTILEVHPKFPLEEQDMYGNTLFLLSFLNGNSELCRLALRNGACMGAINHQGQSVFNIDTPTKQLLFGLLDGLDREPRWADGEQCSECDIKFTLTMRKHHCRHCGRLVCAKCSERQMPILKYEIAKNVRVCQMCFDVLTMGNGSSGTAANSSPAYSTATSISKSNSINSIF